MKRPILAGAVFAIMGAVCSMYTSVFLTVAALLVLTTVNLYVIRLRMLPAVYYIYILAYIGLFLFVYTKTNKVIDVSACETWLEQEANGINCTINGRVSLVVNKNGFTQVQMENSTIVFEDKVIYNAGVLVSVNSFYGLTGDIVQVEGKLKAFERPRNEGQFDSKTYYNSIGMNYKCSAENISITESNNSEIYKIIRKFKIRTAQVYAAIADEQEAGILSSVILGDKENLDSDIKKMYQRSGIAHLLAISGLHISIIGMSLYRGIRKILPFLPAAVCSSVVMICYLCMTGNGISAFRAVTMFIIAVSADVLGRTYDFKTSLSMAALLLVVENGRVILNSGFQLSFTALLGICYVFPALSDMFNKHENKTIKTKLIDSLLLSISIQISTLPVVLMSYYQIPVYGFILNMIVIPLMSLVMISGIIAGIAGLVNLKLGIVFIGMAHYILKFYEWICCVYEKIPGAIAVLGNPSINAVIIYVIIIFVVINWNKYRWIRTSLIVIGVLQLRKIHTPELLINAIDVGQGDSIFVMDNNKNTYLFDGGSTDIKEAGSLRIMPYLKSQAVTKLDYVFISHSDSDHINGIIELITMQDNTFSIYNIVLPQLEGETDDNYKRIVETAKYYGINIMYSNTGSSLFSENGVDITCIHPKSGYKYESANDYSAVYLLKYKNFKMLMTGDAEEKAEKAMLINEELLCDIDILKTGHHGSSSSTSQKFIERVKPEAAVISCGVNNSYGHPHQKILDRLKENNCITYVTAELGAIEIITDGDTYYIDHFLK